MITRDMLIPFCSTDEGRFWMHNPFTIELHTYATDGRIMVRVPRMAGVPDCDVHYSARVLEVAREIDCGPVQWTVLDTVVIPPPVMTKCEFFPCDDPCGDCTPDGQYEKDVPVIVGNKKLNSIYLRKLQALPFVRIAATCTSREGCAPFIFDYGAGLLMPMRWEAC